MLREQITVGCIDADGICASQTPAGAGNLILNGALTRINGESGKRDWLADVPRVVAITSAADDTGKNFTITGENSLGTATTETKAGVNGGAQTFATVWKRINNIAVDAATAGAVTVGTTATVQTQAVPVDIMSNPIDIGIKVDVADTPTVTYSVQHTADNIFDPSATITWTDNDTLTGIVSTDGDANYVAGITATRCSMTSFTAGSLRFTVIQAGPNPG